MRCAVKLSILGKALRILVKERKILNVSANKAPTMDRNKIMGPAKKLDEKYVGTLFDLAIPILMAGRNFITYTSRFVTDCLRKDVGL